MPTLIFALLSPALISAAPPETDASAATSPVEVRVGDVLVHAKDVDPSKLRELLELRLPGRDISTYDPDAAAGERIAVLQVQSVANELAISLVLADGRAYFRTIAAAPDQLERTVATAVANLIAAIESDQVLPDEEGVVPEEILTVQRPKLRSALPAPKPAPEPTPTEKDPEPFSAQPVVEDHPPTPQPAGLEIGLSAAPVASLGLAGSPLFRGAGGTGQVALRFPDGALLLLSARGLGQRANGYGLHRVRVALGAGYDLRVGRFELPIGGALTVEPWWIDGERPSTGAGGPTPLLGLRLGLMPSFRAQSKRGRVAFTLGVSAELAASAELRGGAFAPTVRVAGNEQPSFRLGGPEASAGVVFGLWIPTRRPPSGESAPPPRPAARVR